jgi:putative phosphoribosyl transferase
MVLSRERPGFADRLDAGQQLAEEMLHRGYAEEDAVVLAIPRGGVAVAYPVAKALRVPLGLIIPRKIPIPGNPEAGFGAVTADGTVILNQPLVAQLGLPPEVIARLAQRVLGEVQRRLEEYSSHRSPPELKGKTAILIDDGLASGFTMIAAIRAAIRQEPAKVVVAVPVSPASSVRRVEPLVDELICLITRETRSFAVASFYQHFPDLSDDEVKAYLRAVEETS